MQDNKKQQKSNYRKAYKTGEDIDMINERRYEEGSYSSHRNICDTHEDGA
ncbi:MAG: hypothetical protein WCS51_01125 [Bacilli bacterium]|jgi:hypothetical protein